MPLVPNVNHTNPLHALILTSISILLSIRRPGLQIGLFLPDILLLLLLLLLLFTEIELSLGGSSPYPSTDTTNKNRYT